MSDLAYFDYALVRPEELYLIEVRAVRPEAAMRGQETIVLPKSA
jgi:hypothetical protein